MQLKSNHLFLTSGQDLINLISPLKKYHINYFSYRKFYTDKSRIFLGTRPDWFERYFSQNYYLQGNTEAKPELYQQQAVLSSTLPNQSFSQDIRDFGIGHVIYLIEPHPEYCEFFAFGSSPDQHQIINFYLNNIDLLKKFSMLFKEQASSLLKKAEDHKIALPYHQTTIPQYQMCDLPKAFLQKGECKNRKITLSPRQLECVNLLLKGGTSKEMARCMNLSFRTVEDYVLLLKQKFNARNKGDLMLKISDYFRIN